MVENKALILGEGDLQPIDNSAITAVNCLVV
jgi:hypothetical protein